MRFWYSVNGKKFFRSNITAYNAGSNTYYGAITNGEDFIATDGSTGKYMQTSGSQSSLANAQDALANGIFRYYLTPFVSHSATSGYTRYYLCLDNTTFDDTKYSMSGQLDTSTYVINISRSYPGSSVLTVTNSGASAISFNAIEFVTGLSSPAYRLAADNTSLGTAKEFLLHAVLLDETITVPAGGTYSVTFTV